MLPDYFAFLLGLVTDSRKLTVSKRFMTSLRAVFVHHFSPFAGWTDALGPLAHFGSGQGIVQGLTVVMCGGW